MTDVGCQRGTFTDISKINDEKPTMSRNVGNKSPSHAAPYLRQLRRVRVTTVAVEKQ
jgi:hypothetical protein